MNRNLIYLICLALFCWFQFSAFEASAQCVITLQPGPNDGQDARLFSLPCSTAYAYQNGWCETSNLGFSDEMGPSAWTFMSYPAVMRSLLRFDLDSLAQAGCTVTRATLVLAPTGDPTQFHCGSNTSQHPCNDNSFEISRVTQSWDENIVTWVTRPSVVNSVPGQDRVVVPNEDQPYVNYYIDLTQMVNYWLNNPTLNFGLQMKLLNEQYYSRAHFATSEHQDPSRRPKLELTLNCQDPCDILLQGNVFDDQDADCTFDINERGLGNWLVKILPGPYYASTDSNGYWQAFVSGSNFTVTQEIPNHYLWDSVCPVGPNSYNLTGLSSGDTVSALNFARHADHYCPDLTVDVGANFLRKCHNENYIIRYCNDGNIMATGVYVEVTFDTSLTVVNSQFPPTSVSGNTYTYTIDTLLPGQCGQFWVTTLVSCNASFGDIYCVTAEIFPQDTCGEPQDPGWDRSSVQVTGRCVGDSLACFTILNTGSSSNGNMQGTSPYRIYENGNLVATGTFQLCGGCDTTICWPTQGGNTIRLEADQRPGHPGNSRPNDVVENCGGSGNGGNTRNSQPQDDQDRFVETDCQEVRASWDPNDKAVIPEGLDQQHFILAGDELEYKIRFQNTGNDTAFLVVVKDTLDPALDIQTVRAGVSSHDYDFRIYGDRVMEWRFEHILLPDSNVNEPESHGFLKFKVRQMPNLPLGTVIRNKVGIYFDFNDPVITNEVFNTIGEAQTVNLTPSDFGLKGISVYPNPTSDRIWISGENLPNGAEIRLLDMRGTIYHQGKLQAGNPAEIILESMPGGVYLLRINAPEGNKTVRVVLMK